MKLAEVTPVCKPNKPRNDIDSYRPITVNSNFIKIFEILLNNNINAFLKQTNILPLNQYGFRTNFSTESQLVDLIYYLNTNINDKMVKYIDTIFIDKSNAFDSIPHNLLIEKLYKIGISGNFLKLLNDFLDNRQQYVVYNNTKSHIRPVTSGTPQGSIISPTLFNLYLYDLPNFCKNSLLLQYADDSALIKPIRTDTDIQLLQNDLNYIVDYSKINGLKINVTKTYNLRVNTQKFHDYNVYKINNDYIESVRTHRHLGIILDYKLNFNDNIDNIVNKSVKKWSTLKHICKKAYSLVFLSLYKTYPTTDRIL